MNTEQQLLNGVRDGDRTAMRRLYDTYSGYAMATVLRYVPDRDDASDILQDAFVKILSSVAQFEYRGEGSLKSWVMRIAANEALGWLRKRKDIAFTDKIPDTSSLDDDPDVDSVTDEVLADMIASLPDGYRVVLNLYVFEGLSHKDIAARLGITPSTSASQFFHAKKMLARKIKAYCESECK